MAHMDLRNSSSSETTAAPAAAEGSPATNDSSSSSSAATGRRGRKQLPDGRVFFHLATVVNDPWDVTLSDAVASDYAWVSKDELEQYIQDDRLLALAHKML